MEQEGNGWILEPYERYEPHANPKDMEIQDTRHRQFIMVDYVVVEAMSVIGSKAFGVYAALAKFATRNRKAWPSWKRLQSVTGLGRDALRKALRILEKAQFITIHQGRRGGRLSTNIYILHDLTNWQAPPWMSDKNGVMHHKNGRTTLSHADSGA